MQVAIKSLIFALLVGSFASAQDCSRDDINYENIQKSGLTETYNHGDVVKVTCATGYVGFLKLICTNGRWRQEGGRECKKRPCGHPGDTPNGDFKLIGETEFVFGARVEYTCRPGYLMASRVSTRNCRSQGWDNAVPVCEVVKCPTIKSSDELIATGNTEEASFDDVVHFECASRHLMLEGAEDIHCTEQGTWSAPVPKCTEIRCKLPEITHGTITNRQMEYKENEQLRYMCNKGYRPRHGTPKCLRSGWSITPECEEITCILGPITPGTVRTSPPGKNVFQVGESVEITCSERYWLVTTKERSQRIKCQEDGQWEHSPVCEEMTCDIPYDQHVSSPSYYFSWDRRVGVKKSYYCESGYKPAASTATCTRNGWSPTPLCIEITCTAPTIENAQMLERPQHTYEPGASLEVQCLPGYKPDSFFITCDQQGEWYSRHRCTRSASTCLQPKKEMSNGAIKEPQKLKDYYRTGDTVKYKCSEGFMFEKDDFALCGEQGWTYPKCIPIPDTCVTFRLENGLMQYVTEDAGSLKPSHIFYYTCDENYKTFEGTLWGVTGCRQGAWTFKPQCIRNDQCGRFPNIPHGKVVDVNKVYNENQRVSFQCDPGYKTDTQVRKPYITCQRGAWTTTAECKLIGDTCGRPPQVENAVIESYQVESHQTTVTYKCREHFEATERPIYNCIGKRWDNIQQLKCNRSKSTCEQPKHDLSNGYIKEPQKLKDYYGTGDTVEYKCSEGFMFEKENSAICSGQDWTYPQCIRLECKQPKKDISNGFFEESQKLRDFYNSGDRVEYKCSEGFRTKDETSAVCDGQNWIYPQCIPLTCLQPEKEIRNGAVKEPRKLRDSYSIRDTVEYKCSEGFTFEKEKFAVCDGQDWTYPQCKPFETARGSTEAASGSTTTECGPSPVVEHAIYDSKGLYRDGEEVTYDCPALFVKEGDERMICRRGIWIGKIKCIEPCTVDVDDLDPRHIQLQRGGRRKIYAEHGDYITFICKRGYYRKGDVDFRQQCNHGVIPKPVCE